MGKKIFLFLFLVSVSGLVLYLLEDPFQDQFVSKKVPVFNFKPDTIKKIEIEYLVDGLRLIREGEGWMISPMDSVLRQKIGEEKAPTEEKFAADAKKIGHLLDVFSGLDRGEAVSVNPENHGRFQVTQMGLHVRLFDEAKKIGEIVLGKQGPNFQSTYIRLGEEPQVYLVEEYLKAVVNSSLSYWKSEEVLKSEVEATAELEKQAPIERAKTASKKISQTSPLKEPAKEEPKASPKKEKKKGKK